MFGRYLISACALTMVGCASKPFVAVELDQTMVQILQTEVTASNFEVVEADVLDVDPSALILANTSSEILSPYHVVANLPYYITTPIMFHFWESSLFFERMVVMVQEEVGLRGRE